MLRPCQFRNVNDSGQLVCAKIARGDHEVSPEICRACPVASINCKHLRFSLEKQGSGAIVVHYANGRTETWDGEAARVHLQRAACSVLLIPLSGPAMCSTCSLRCPAVADDAVERPVISSQPRAGKIVALPARQEPLAS